MKQKIKKTVIALLKKRVQKAVRQSHSKIYGITGSVGKTTAREVLTSVLKLKYQVRSSTGGFNTPIGLLLSLLGEKESGFSNPAKWLGILWRAYTREIRLPERIVLEYGVDKKGDMNKLLKIVRPDVAILTHIAPVHLAEGQFSSVKEIAQEKMKLLKSSKFAIASKESGQKADVIPQVEQLKNEKNGFSFIYEKQKYFIPVFGAFHYNSFVPAIIIGLQEGIKAEDIANKLAHFQVPAGRGRILKGINDSVIWDSSYNASPEAVKKMLETMPDIPAKRRIALLGNMNELGEQSSIFHAEVGRKAVAYTDLIFFVGEEAEAFSKGVAGRRSLKIFPDAQSVGQHLKAILQKGDLILVKGSQNKVRLERAVVEILKYRRDQNKLCRQGAEWAKIN